MKPYGLKQHEKHAPRCPCCDNWDRDERSRNGTARQEARMDILQGLEDYDGEAWISDDVEMEWGHG